METKTDETITVEEPIEYTDRSLPTACNWIKYEIQPGTYPVHLWFSYRKVRVQARRIESYYVNRLFTASIVDHQVTPDAEIQPLTVPAWAVGAE